MNTPAAATSILPDARPRLPRAWMNHGGTLPADW